MVGVKGLQGMSAIQPFQFEPEAEPEPEPEETHEAGPAGPNVECEDGRGNPCNELEWDSPEDAVVNATDRVHQNPKSWDEWATGRRSENQEDRHVEDEEFFPSLSVGDGRFLVDLGSSSEFIVDEECLFQLFRRCQKCDEHCRVRKRVEGLKITLSHICDSCRSHFKWTNLPESDDNSGESEF